MLLWMQIATEKVETCTILYSWTYGLCGSYAIWQYVISNLNSNLFMMFFVLIIFLSLSSFADTLSTDFSTG